MGFGYNATPPTEVRGLQDDRCDSSVGLRLVYNQITAHIYHLVTPQFQRGGSDHITNSIYLLFFVFQASTPTNFQQLVFLVTVMYDSTANFTADQADNKG